MKNMDNKFIKKLEIIEENIDKKNRINKEKLDKYRKTIQIITVFGVIFTIILSYFILNGSYFKPESEGGMFTVHLKQLGVFGPIIFLIIQIIQVVIPIIPGGLVSVAGHFVFGVLWGFIYNFIGIFIGSVIAFMLSRKYGEFVVKCFVSDEIYDKYMGWTQKENKFAWIFGTLLFLPFAPDDTLVMIAGLTRMRFKTFLLIFIPTKMVSTYVFTYLMQIGILKVINDIIPWLHQFMFIKSV